VILTSLLISNVKLLHFMTHWLTFGTRYSFFLKKKKYPVPVMVSINWIYRNYKVRWSLFPKFHHVGGISFVVHAFFFIFLFFLLKEHLFLTCSSGDRLVATKHWFQFPNPLNIEHMFMLVLIVHSEEHCWN